MTKLTDGVGLIYNELKKRGITVAQGGSEVQFLALAFGAVIDAFVDGGIISSDVVLGNNKFYKGQTTAVATKSAIGINGTDQVSIDADGLGTVFGGAITAGTIAASAITASGAVRLANLTTTQRDALTPAAGMTIFNTTTGKAQCYNGSTWSDLF